MKKPMMLIAACLMSFAPHSFAQTNQTFDLEDGAMSNEELVTKLDFGAMQIGSKKGDVVAGAIIGLIAGAIAAEALDSQIEVRYRDNGRYNDRYNDGYNDGWNRPGRPGRPGHGGRPGPGRPHYPPPRPQPMPQVVCYAQSPYGQVFRTFGYNARMAQNDALMKCSQFSYGCRPAGCQVVGGW